MKIAPSSAATKPPTRRWRSVADSAVPTRTGATAAGSVRSRAAMIQMRTLDTRWSVLRPACSHVRVPWMPGAARRRGVGLVARPPSSGGDPAPRNACRRVRGSWNRPSGPAGELREVGRALGLVGLAPLARLVGGVEEEVGVVGELLDAGVAVLVGVEARLDQAQGEGGQGEHLAAPADRLLLEAVERYDGVDEPHVERLLGVVLAAQQPDLPGLLGAHQVAQQRRAEAAVPRAHARAGLPEAGVVGRDGEVAHEVKDVAAAHRVPRDHRDDGLGQAADLDVQVGDVEAADAAARLGLVALVAAHALVAARAEGERPLAGEDDHADLGVLAGALEGGGELDHRLRAERVADLGAVDGDLGDPVAAELVADVLVLGAGRPRHWHGPAGYSRAPSLSLPVPRPRRRFAPPPRACATGRRPRARCRPRRRRSRIAG